MTEQTNWNGKTAEEWIEALLHYALAHGMMEPMDTTYTRNGLLDLFQLEAPAAKQIQPMQHAHMQPLPLTDILTPLIDMAAERGLIPDNTVTERDLFDARIMGLVMPRPSAVEHRFQHIRREHGIERATTDFYKLSQHANYIRMDRIRKNLYWEHQTEYGNLQITVNLSKPEKDPKEIAKLRQAKTVHYPQCVLCKENVGYAGRVDHPARQNLRILPFQLNEENWYFQYSPYLYYEEHSIVFREEHVPMQITGQTFRRLLDFTEQMPHYFIGSNADLPIVGGSILSHDHFQAGKHRFPIEDAKDIYSYQSIEETNVRASIVAWPMSVVRLTGRCKEEVARAAEALLAAWKGYSDAEHEIQAYSEQAGERIPHNSITPIVRRNGENYVMDLVLRNNRTNEEHPEGIFHPHRPLHHIKKENIGLIEVMGLAILPGRLQEELSAIERIIKGEDALSELAADSPLHKHRTWIAEMMEADVRPDSLTEAEGETWLHEQVGEKFSRVLADAGVFKQTESGRAGFDQFMIQSGWQRK
ncbi:UDP-glucose--hexose-1-phosphate uridylyltransferase [Marinicrinis sediminis]|uniref:Galactose-1-phosphate uridylyltransferase n=1 Tax=Marinicrinis sediminis TaxID=1652465 RepID=A0ABW5R5X7_9BACL